MVPLNVAIGWYILDLLFIFSPIPRGTTLTRQQIGIDLHYVRTLHILQVTLVFILKTCGCCCPFSCCCFYFFKGYKIS